jgi:hypothetical protein
MNNQLNEPYFERNRFFLSANYRISPLFSTQLGYMRQLTIKSMMKQDAHFFSLAPILTLILENNKTYNVSPPSTFKQVPVTKPAFSEARKR